MVAHVGAQQNVLIKQKVTVDTHSNTVTRGSAEQERLDTKLSAGQV